MLKVEAPGTVTEFLAQYMWGNEQGYFKVLF